MQDFFTSHKDLLLQLKACGVDKSKEEKRMVFTILSKLGPDYSVFVSTFHTQSLTAGALWTMPSLETFIEALIQEEGKLINMGVIKNSKAHALDAHDDNSSQHQKSKKKSKEKIHVEKKKEGYSKPFNDSSGSKSGKGKK
jgi:hypothetical protein